VRAKWKFWPNPGDGCRADEFWNQGGKQILGWLDAKRWRTLCLIKGAPLLGNLGGGGEIKSGKKWGLGSHTD